MSVETVTIANPDVAIILFIDTLLNRALYKRMLQYKEEFATVEARCVETDRTDGCVSLDKYRKGLTNKKLAHHEQCQSITIRYQIDIAAIENRYNLMKQTFYESLFDISAEITKVFDTGV